MTGKMYGWTKYGGANHGLVKEELDYWYCQVCGDKQTRLLPSYMFPMDETQRDFARVCSDCKATAKVKHVIIFFDLLQIIKKI